MRDLYGREINYMRISVTDVCNLNCFYCNPKGKGYVASDLLSYEDILRICRLAIKLGINSFKVTGGEPFARPGLIGFLKELKMLDGLKNVTLTTNATLLKPYLNELANINIDGINISLDASTSEAYRQITGSDRFSDVDIAIRECASLGINTKINAVILKENEDQLCDLSLYAKNYPIHVRYIERMPIGAGALDDGARAERLRERLLGMYPDLHPIGESFGNGPAVYEESEALQGKIGWIRAISEGFCENCNKLRLTANGYIKLCLCYGDIVDIGGAIKSGASDEDLLELLKKSVLGKPKEHCFSELEKVSEKRSMSQIGG